MTNEDVSRFLAAAEYEQDDREPPDARRRGRFKAGWEDATLRKQNYTAATMRRLTWHNLGYRFGEGFGVQPEDSVYQVYDLLAFLYVSAHGLSAARLPEEIDDGQPLVEGAASRITVNAYERNPEVRRRCIARHGADCSVCGVNFGQTYGLVAEGYIHVHHLRPLSEIGGEYTVNPERDVVPVCPNCHAVIHRHTPAFTIDEVRAFLRRPR